MLGFLAPSFCCCPFPRNLTADVTRYRWTMLLKPVSQRQKFTALTVNASKTRSYIILYTGYLHTSPKTHNSLYYTITQGIWLVSIGHSSLLGWTVPKYQLLICLHESNARLPGLSHAWVRAWQLWKRIYSHGIKHLMKGVWFPKLHLGKLF